MIDLAKSAFHHVRVVGGCRMTLTGKDMINPAHVDHVFDVAYDEAEIQKGFGYNFTQLSVSIDNTMYYVVCNSISYDNQ